MTSDKPSPLVCHVYHEHFAHFGKADEGIVFDERSAAKPTPEFMPRRIEVLAWHADDDIGITTFATIGMSGKRMNNAEHRAELHLAVRAKLSDADVQAVSRFLANLATYPFHYETHLDWWHKVRDPGTIPLFTNATSVLMHPRFVDEGWDCIHYDDGTHVKLLNVIPISAEAYQIKSRGELFDYVWQELEDPFTPW